MRCGVPAWELTTGHPLAHDLQADEDLYRDLVEHGGAFAFVAAGLLDLPASTVAGRVALSCPGSVVLARAGRDTGRLPDTVVVAPPTALAVPATEAGDLPVTFLAEACEAGADVLEASGPTGASTEEAVVVLAGTGAAPRSVGDPETRAAEAGWRVLGRTSLGRDHEVLDLGR
ncbi:hypothetical protein F1C76_21855 [Geodermatophilaceae bacterium NBWT11]|nr:hypothetical protein F1C76_21855 [Geodermatophilaceae bacterium NBWT11]